MPARRHLAAPLVLALAACTGATDPHAALTVAGALGTPTAAVVSQSTLRVAVAVDGQAGGRLIVDSGAPLTTLSPTAWPGVSLPYSATIDSLAVGDVTIGHLPVLGADLFGATPGAAAGLLGGNTLCRFAAVLDYRAPSLRLGASGFDAPAVVGAVAAARAVPFRLEGGSDNSMANAQGLAWPATRVVVSALVEGAPRTLVVDSGSSYVVLRHALFDALVSDGRKVLGGVRIGGAGDVLEGRLTRSRSVALADTAVAGAAVLDVGDALLDRFAAEIGEPVDGLLGGAYLREFLVTIDYPARTLGLARYAARDHIDPLEFQQIGLTLAAAPGGSHRWSVVGIFDGTSAARAGITVGDEVIAIDGTQLDALEQDAARATLHGPAGAQKQVQTARGTFMVMVEDLLPPLP